MVAGSSPVIPTLIETKALKKLGAFFGSLPSQCMLVANQVY